MFQNSTQPNTKKEENANLQIEIANINNPGNIICHTHTYIYKPQNLNLEKRNSSTKKKKIIESTKKLKHVLEVVTSKFVSYPPRKELHPAEERKRKRNSKPMPSLLLPMLLNA